MWLWSINFTRYITKRTVSMNMWWLSSNWKILSTFREVPWGSANQQPGLGGCISVCWHSFRRSPSSTALHPWAPLCWVCFCCGWHEKFCGSKMLYIFLPLIILTMPQVSSIPQSLYNPWQTTLASLLLHINNHAPLISNLCNSLSLQDTRTHTR